MSLNKGESGETRIENHAGEKPKSSGIKGFVKKWWWALLIVFAIGVLVVVLPL